jgi:nucleoside-diphosphate-sugar epimerase
VFVLNAATTARSARLPDGVTWLTGDVTDDASLLAAIGDQRFDAVVNFLSYDADDVRRMVAMFGSRIRQYVHISSGSIYAKPVQQSPITESTPIAPNPVLEYATAKWRAELALQKARTEQGFPVTIVRPSHTYDDANPPVPGGWTVVDRIARGAEIPVHGDGTSLWTLTHAEDFAQGLVGLLGNPRSIGEVFNITGDDVYTWDQIYTILADALGVRPSSCTWPRAAPVVAPDWFWSGEVLGTSATGVRHQQDPAVVPGFAPKLTFHRAAAPHGSVAEPSIPRPPALTRRPMPSWTASSTPTTRLGRLRRTCAATGRSSLVNRSGVLFFASWEGPDWPLRRSVSAPVH